jgi:uncharacterized membrane protein YccC
MVGRAGARTDQMRKELLVMDELTADQQQADHERLRALEHNPEIEQELARKIEERIAAMREQEGKPPAK